MIQDLIIAAVQFVFMLALIPTAFNPRSVVPPWTSALTAAGCCVLAGTFLTLGLVVSAGTSVGSAGLWGFICGVRLPRKERWDGV